MKWMEFVFHLRIGWVKGVVPTNKWGECQFLCFVNSRMAKAFSPLVIFNRLWWKLNLHWHSRGNEIFVDTAAETKSSSIQPKLQCIYLLGTPVSSNRYNVSKVGCVNIIIYVCVQCYFSQGSLHSTWKQLSQVAVAQRSAFVNAGGKNLHGVQTPVRNKPWMWLDVATVSLELFI